MSDDSSVPPWRGSETPAADLRTQTHGLLTTLADAFRTASGDSDVPGHLHAEDIDRLRKIFNPGQCRAIGEFTSELKELLFNSPLEFPSFRENGGDVYMVEFMDNALLDDLNRAVSHFFTKAGEKELSPDPNTLTHYLQTWNAQLNSTIQVAAQKEQRPSTTAALYRWAGKLQESGSKFTQALDLAQTAAIAHEAAVEATYARDAARRAASETGALTMGTHFWQIATAEGKSAWMWTLVAFGSVFAVIGLGIWIASSLDTSKWMETVVHLVVILPIVGAASYASRIARHHRLLARWAKTASVQINSVEAFSKQLSSPQNRDKLILELGRNIFSTPTYGDDAKGDQLSAVPVEILDTLKEIVQRLPNRPA